MQTVKLIAVFGLIVGLAGQSHAGFRDALKSAAGSALNEVAGTAIVSQEIPVKDGSMRSAEEVRKDNQFSDEEYQQWLKNVIKQLAEYQSQYAAWKPVSGISPNEMVADGKRAAVSADEATAVFCVVEDQGIFLAQEYVYFFAGNACLKFNYATLASGRCDERGDVLSNSEASRVISVIEKACDSAREKIAGEKDEKDRLVASLERQKQAAIEAQKRDQLKNEEEARRQDAAAKAAEEKAKQESVVAQESAKLDEQKTKELEQLKTSRSGLVAYAPASIQWGDSVSVIKQFTSAGFVESMGDGQYIARRFEKNEERMDVAEVRTFIYENIGVYEIDITYSCFSPRQTADVLMKKFCKEFGVSPKKDGDVYSWESAEKTVTLSIPESTESEFSMRATLSLSTPDMLKKYASAKQAAEQAAQEKDKKAAQKMLDF